MSERARHQDIRGNAHWLTEHDARSSIGSNRATVFRLVGACNQIVQFHMHPFTIDGLPRSPKAQAHIDKYYESFTKIRQDGLDALIISGANVTQQSLPEEDFWQPLTEVFSWARENVASVLCSCLATHAIIQYRYGIARTRLPNKRWGVFAHKVIDRSHPLVAEINTRFDVPHSRFNEIFQSDIEHHGLKILAASCEAGVHLAVSEDGFRIVFFKVIQNTMTLACLKNTNGR